MPDDVFRVQVAKMAAAAVVAELKFRDGLRQKITVNVEDSISSLLNGIHELNKNASLLLSELVEREKLQGDSTDEEEESEDEEPKQTNLRPPSKRLKFNTMDQLLVGSSPVDMQHTILTQQNRKGVYIQQECQKLFKGTREVTSSASVHKVSFVLQPLMPDLTHLLCVNEQQAPLIGQFAAPTAETVSLAPPPVLPASQVLERGTRPAPDLLQTRPCCSRPAPDLLQTCSRPDPAAPDQTLLLQTCSRPALDLLQTCSRPAPDLLQTCSRPDPAAPDLLQTCSRPHPAAPDQTLLLQTCSRPAPDHILLLQTCSRPHPAAPDLLQTCSRPDPAAPDLLSVLVSSGHGALSCVRSMTMDLLGQLQCPVCRCRVDGDSPAPNVSLARIIEVLQEASVSGAAPESCPQHHNPLSLYCEDERTVICGLCGSIGAHRGHKITPVSVVYSHMKEDISCLMTEFQNQKRKVEDQICKMANNKSRITNESDVLKWVVRKEFGELRRHLELEEAGFMHQVESSAAALISSLQNQTDKLNQNLSRLQEAHNTLQDLSNEGHLGFIRKYGSIAPRFREIQELQQKQDRIFSSLNFKPGFNHNDIKLTVWKRLQRKVLPAPEPLKLDPQTAHPMLELRCGATFVVCGAVVQRLSDCPERFSYSYCVLASRGFSSGKHFWEVEVGNKPKWRLGLIKGTISRKVKLVKNPESGVWLIGLKDGVYEAFNSPRVVLPIVCPPQRVGLFLDYEGRGLTFYNMDSPDELSLIYSFRLEVQGKVYPLLDVCWHDRGAPQPEGPSAQMFPSRMNQSGLMFAPMDELQELAFIERPIRRSLKTAEEIDQLTVDEDLNDIERAVYLLSVGQEVQRASVISNLPSLVRQNPAETFRRIVPKVREVLSGAGADIQLAAAASFLTILQDDIILIHTHTYSILKTVLLHLNHRDTVVSNAWLEALLLAINALPKETIKQEVLNPLLCQSQLSHSLQARLASCRILGKVATKFDSQIVKAELLPLVRSLCQDMEFEVRACMCRQLEPIARASGVDDTRTELLPELVELAEDEDSSVRLAAFDTIINLMEMMDDDDRLHVVVPLVMSVCEVTSQTDKTVVTSLSFQFGKLCSGLEGSLSNEQKLRLLQMFKLLCVAGLQTDGNQSDNNELTLIRCNCCYNLPAMVLFAEPAHFLPELYPSFSSLCSDPEVSVRRGAAASLHQVMKVLGSDVHLVHKELLCLLQDDGLEVLDALMNHLEETLEVVLSRGDNLTPDNKVQDLLSALLVAEQKVGCSLRWRLHEKLLQRYCCLARILPGDLLHQNFSPRIFIILTTNKVLPVQKEAARTFCIFLRYNRKQEQRQQMMERLIQDLAQGRSYWNRLRFLDVCETATEIFSRKYFNKHFLIPALELVHDPVANVRYKLCQLLPRLRSSLRLPADKQLLQQLDFCVQKLLCREKDKDVVATIRKTVLELDKLDLTEPFQKRQERDLLDQKKEKEETLLLEMEQLERQQTDGKLNTDKHIERKRRDSKTSLSATKSMSVSSSGAASGKEMRKAKLSRSRSLSSQPTSSKSTNSDRPLKVKELSCTSGPGKSSILSNKDDCLKATHFTMATPSTSMPVLIRSNTTSLLDRAGTLEHRASAIEKTSTLDKRARRTVTLEHRNNMIEQRSTTVDHRTSTLDQRDHRTSTLDHRTSSLEQREPRVSVMDHRTSVLEQRSKTMDRGNMKETQSRKLSTNRKSNSFSVQSEQD
ncbi:uncharacterized protein V6R79_020124 [Siganus canaliculatus]